MKAICADSLVDASFTDVVSPNSDTLYCQVQFNLTNEPIVITVPPISDRYYSFEFLDAYTNVFSYIGTRATGSAGGTYLLAGPDWKISQINNGSTYLFPLVQKRIAIRIDTPCSR
jgi:hypothetical protein